jgi:hypothetical protein
MNHAIAFISTSMENAKKVLRENPTESLAVAARIFDVNVKTLLSSIKNKSGESRRS